VVLDSNLSHHSFSLSSSELGSYFFFFLDFFFSLTSHHPSACRNAFSSSERRRSLASCESSTKSCVQEEAKTRKDRSLRDLSRTNRTEPELDLQSLDEELFRTYKCGWLGLFKIRCTRGTGNMHTHTRRKRTEIHESILALKIQAPHQSMFCQDQELL